ncbi:photosystem reaction center subunit H [Methanosarcinales archaeon ex4572_44]|nr:MAG: photosystem reaction center subunit H [Methanosarcinales archaeon ex4572_44]RLG24743.1 MAG: photosystem reaction center subunit H [Methanosarcinales archaeon]
MRVEISTLFGLDVYTDKGIYVGRVNDVQLDLDEQKIIGLATNRLNPNLFDTTNHGVIIPFRWVLAIADIVLIRQVAKQFKKPEKEEEEI